MLLLYQYFFILFSSIIATITCLSFFSSGKMLNIVYGERNGSNCLLIPAKKNTGNTVYTTNSIYKQKPKEA